MKKVFWILFVVACSSSSSPGEYIEPADEDDKAFEIECTEHKDCYPEHTFCVKGLCTGEPQPEFLPTGENASTGAGVEEDATVEPQGSPWGRVNYRDKDAGTLEDTAVENDTEIPPNEEPPDEVPVCLEDADCDDGDANTWDYCIGFACLNVVGVSNEPECATDSDCPASACTETICQNGLCIVAEVEDNCWVCQWDSDCTKETLCNVEKFGGRIEITGKCLSVGKCEVILTPCAKGCIGTVCAENCPSEICDGLDNDCDGETDEGVLNKCGECGPEPYEYCNGLDDDCDGAVDEVCACLPNAEQDCTMTDFVYYELGECKYGTQKCVNGNWGACVGAVGPVQETCDSKDNDCDGKTDNGVLKPDGSCADCLSDADCPSGGSCDCTEDGNVLCVGTTGKCLFGECQTDEVETKCKFGCVNSECLQCLNDTDCDDGNACTVDSCVAGDCGHLNVAVAVGDKYCVSCNSDDDCLEFTICLDGNLQNWSGQCVAGKCEMESTSCPFGCADYALDGCAECKVDDDCFNYSNYWCDDENHVKVIGPPECIASKCGQYTTLTECEFGCDNSLCNECGVDADCDDGNTCTKDICEYVNPYGAKECVYQGFADVKCTGLLQCSFQCPAEMKYAVVWFGANQTANIECGTGAFKVVPKTLCLWGQANPTFKYNLWDGQNWWAWGEKAVLSCNDESFTVTPDPNLGNAGVQIVSFPDVTCSF